MEPFLMQNLSLVHFCFWRYDAQTVSLKREQVIEFGYLPPGNGFNFFFNEIFMSGRVLCNPKLPPCQFQQFSSRRKFLRFQNFLDISRILKVAAISLVVQVCTIFSKYVLRIKTKSHKVLSMICPIGFRITAVKLVVWTREPPGLIGLKAKKIFAKNLLRGALFFARL